MYRLRPFGEDEYPRGTLAVSLSDRRGPLDRSVWVAAIAWVPCYGLPPRIVYDARVLGDTSRDPDSGAAWAVVAASTDYPTDAVIETAIIDSMTWRHGTWARRYGDAVYAYARGLPSMGAARV
jgi:hypothetical protein